MKKVVSCISGCLFLVTVVFAYLACGEGDSPTAPSMAPAPEAPAPVPQVTNSPAAPTAPTAPVEPDTAAYIADWSNDGKVATIKMESLLDRAENFGFSCYGNGLAPLDQQRLVEGGVNEIVLAGKKRTMKAPLECGTVNQCDLYFNLDEPLVVPNYGGNLVSAQHITPDDCEPPPPNKCKNQTLDLTVTKEFLAAPQVVNGTVPPPALYKVCAISTQPGTVLEDGQPAFDFPANSETCELFRYGCGQTHMFTAKTECLSDHKTVNTKPCGGECPEPRPKPECPEQTWDEKTCSWVGECECPVKPPPECPEQEWIGWPDCEWIGECPDCVPPPEGQIFIRPGNPTSECLQAGGALGPPNDFYIVRT
jgi:hypothetical protein